jgi:CRISPR-associated exonuclease Cas4
MLRDLADAKIDSIPIGLIRQFAFCPRIPYFTEVCGIRPPTPLWVNQGIEFHGRESELFKRREIAKFGLESAEPRHQVELQSQQYGVHGIADLVLVSRDQVSVIEFKMHERSIHRGAVLQLFLYAKAAAEVFASNAYRGFFVFGKRGRTREVRFNEAVEQDALRTLDSLRKTMLRSVMPESSAGPLQCGQCEYIQRCNDRD